MTPAATTALALEGVGIFKSFGHVDALRGATLGVGPGEIVALFGDNGAGKSTFLRVLCGMVVPDRGDVLVTGEPTALTSIRDAQARGIEVIHQDLALAPHLSTLENVFLGHERMRAGWMRRLQILDRAAMATKADDALQELSIALPSVRVPVSALSGGQQQAVAIARAVLWSQFAILMDEPTAALGTRQSDVVCETMQKVAARGLGVMVISHDIPRMLRVAHRAAVLRRGTIVLDAPAAELAITDIVHAMVGDLQSD
jgi:simple sugar transport system ATP-binding protein